MQTTNCKLIWMIRDFEFKWTYAPKPVQFFFLPYRNKSRMCTWTYISGKSNLLCNLHYADPLQSCVLKSAAWALGDNFNDILEIPAVTMLLNWQRILMWNWGTFLIFLSRTKLEKLETLIMKFVFRIYIFGEISEFWTFIVNWDCQFTSPIFYLDVSILSGILFIFFPFGLIYISNFYLVFYIPFLLGLFHHFSFTFIFFSFYSIRVSILLLNSVLFTFSASIPFLLIVL